MLYLRLMKLELCLQFAQPRWVDIPTQERAEWLFWRALPCFQACVQLLSHVWLFVTPWTVAHQAPLSMGFSKQEYWSGLPFPPPGDPPDPEIEPVSLVLQADSLTPSHWGAGGGGGGFLYFPVSRVNHQEWVDVCWLPGLREQICRSWREFWPLRAPGCFARFIHTGFFISSLAPLTNRIDFVIPWVKIPKGWFSRNQASSRFFPQKYTLDTEKSLSHPSHTMG